MTDENLEHQIQHKSKEFIIVFERYLNNLKDRLKRLKKRIPAGEVEKLERSIKEGSEKLEEAKKHFLGDEKEEDIDKEEIKKIDQIIHKLLLLQKTFSKHKDAFGRLQKLIYIDRKIFHEIRDEIKSLEKSIENLDKKNDFKDSQEEIIKKENKIKQLITNLDGKITKEIYEYDSKHKTEIAEVLEGIKLSKEEELIYNDFNNLVDQFYKIVSSNPKNNVLLKELVKLKNSFKHWHEKELTKVIHVSNEILDKEKLFDKIEKSVIKELQFIIKESGLLSAGKFKNQDNMKNELSKRIKIVINEISSYMCDIRGKADANRRMNLYYFMDEVHESISTLHDAIESINSYIIFLEKEKKSLQP